MNGVITLKQQYWGYSVEEQKSWLANNILTGDDYLLIYEVTARLLKCD